MKLSRPYRLAALAGGLGLAATLWSALAETDPQLALLVGAAAAPLAALFMVWGRQGGGRFPGRSFVGGALIGPAFALATHGFVAAFASLFFAGFAQSGRELLDALKVDPRITEVLSRPWVLLAMVDLVAVAPLTEEVGKALGARLGRPATRRDAFLFGVAAGAGFALVENVLYAAFGSIFGGPWQAIVLGRVLGAAVHPLATGLVVVGWWEWRRDGNLPALARQFLSGAGVHALWNGSLVALFVVQEAFALGAPTGSLGVISLVYSAGIGVVLGAALWRVTTLVAADQDPLSVVTFGEGRAVAAWALLSASLLVPVAALVLAFPGFYFG